MARLGRLGFLGVAVIFHVIYILSIFDVYFRSPIVSGMRAYSVDTARAPAQRLVLYVGDGLRADKAFQFFPDPSPSANHNDSSAQELRPLAPFLRSKVLDEGTFGVSHTRVPTESRPGHVALIAGLYEDVSSVTTGWKLNPVNFDSVFNRSRHTWQWGSPDILPMFSTGAVPGRVTDDTYGAEFEDFSKDATELDYWVFDKVKQLFEDAKTDADLNARLRQDKIVFFLHLLGLDTTGHAYRPYSREYLHNIKVVDEGVKEITKLIDDFYSDDQTAYIFTADHGMSDWGSHGDGHPDNTRTPLIAWGAGVATPNTVSSGTAAGHEDGFSHDWHLDHVQRHDVAQADVATLMAYLAGLEFPVNSVGELPLSYLDASDEEKAKAMLVNAREILEMYRVKEEAKKATVFRYKPYPSFAGVGQTADERLKQLENMAEDGRYQQAIDHSDALMKLGLQGLRYLQTYDWLFLRTLVTAGYLGWIAFAFTTAVDAYILDGKFDAKRTASSVTAFASVLVALYSFLFVQSSPLTYYLYALFPVMFWEEVFVRRSALAAGKNKLFTKFSGEDRVKLSLNFLAYIGILEVMVQSYYHREIYTICYLLATAWPAFYGMQFLRENIILCATWALGCVSMSIFTLLPAIKTESTTMILIGGLLILAVGVMYIATEKSLLSSTSRSKSGLGAPKSDGTSRMILGIQVGLVALAMLVTRSSVASLQAKQGLPLGTQLHFLIRSAGCRHTGHCIGISHTITAITRPHLHQVQRERRSNLTDLLLLSTSPLSRLRAAATKRTSSQIFTESHRQSMQRAITPPSPADWEEYLTCRTERLTRWVSASSLYQAALMASKNGTEPATSSAMPATPTSPTATVASIAQSEQSADTTEELGGIQRTDTDSTDTASVASYGRPTTLKPLRPEDSKVSLLSRLQTNTDVQSWRRTVKRYPVVVQIIIVILFLPVFGAAFLYVCWKHLKRRLSNRSAMDRGRLPSNADYRRPSVADAAMVKPEGEEEVPPEAPEADPAAKPNGQGDVQPEVAEEVPPEAPEEDPAPKPNGQGGVQPEVPEEESKNIKRSWSLRRSWSKMKTSRQPQPVPLLPREAQPPTSTNIGESSRGAVRGRSEAREEDPTSSKRSAAKNVPKTTRPGASSVITITDRSRSNSRDRPVQPPSRNSSRGSLRTLPQIREGDPNTLRRTWSLESVAGSPPRRHALNNDYQPTATTRGRASARPLRAVQAPDSSVGVRRTSAPTSILASLVVPFLHALQPRDHYLHRLVVIFLAFGPMFIILTISYEGLFYLAITATLVSWVRLEHRIHQRRLPTPSPPASTDPSLQLTTPLAPALSAAKARERALETDDYRALTLADARICLFFLFLLQSAFFSTGNIASISSFSLDAVYRLLPIFDPFSQGALLLLKLLAPFALVSANLGILTRRLKLRGGSLFAVVMGIGDYLTLRFFWEVKDEGSWLDIGESITCFVIASMLCIFVAALEALSEVFIKGVEFADDVPMRPEEKGHGNGALNGGMSGKVKPVNT
ncbi:Glycosyl phosphatidyl inositol anchor synthesis [Elasticomyces elasticus]|uniref:GPI ethanolamine phosphate transferase 1 n=1 Tax=Elasticomyces elasticus TaxID=574655 RepID=A0AAN8A2W9_9PEZI|nr:Glycosyl phosphatidyl inositol anchor synthesis [Elasticomyces elasticus]